MVSPILEDIINNMKHNRREKIKMKAVSTALESEGKK